MWVRSRFSIEFVATLIHTFYAIYDVFTLRCTRVGELEEQLTVFINRSFENLTSIEQSLALLEKYQTVLHREAMRHDLSSKVSMALRSL